MQGGGAGSPGLYAFYGPKSSFLRGRTKVTKSQTSVYSYNHNQQHLLIYLYHYQNAVFMVN